MLQALCSSFGCLLVWVLCFHGFLGTMDLVPPAGDGEAKRKINLWLAFPGQAGAHPLPGADPPMI